MSTEPSNILSKEHTNIHATKLMERLLKELAEKVEKKFAYLKDKNVFFSCSETTVTSDGESIFAIYDEDVKSSVISDAESSLWRNICGNLGELTADFFSFNGYYAYFRLRRSNTQGVKFLLSPDTSNRLEKFFFEHDPLELPDRFPLMRLKITKVGVSTNFSESQSPEILLDLEFGEIPSPDPDCFSNEPIDLDTFVKPSKRTLTRR